MSTHGGARPGSGPKPKPDAMVKRMYVLRQDQVDWLERVAEKDQTTRSEIIRKLIDRQRQRAKAFESY